MAAENGMPRQCAPTVALRQQPDDTFALIEAALKQPFFAQRYGQDEIETFV